MWKFLLFLISLEVWALYHDFGIRTAIPIDKIVCQMLYFYAENIQLSMYPQLLLALPLSRLDCRRVNYNSFAWRLGNYEYSDELNLTLPHKYIVASMITPAKSWKVTAAFSGGHSQYSSSTILLVLSHRRSGHHHSANLPAYVIMLNLCHLSIIPYLFVDTFLHRFQFLCFAVCILSQNHEMKARDYNMHFSGIWDWSVFSLHQIWNITLLDSKIVSIDPTSLHYVIL